MKGKADREHAFDYDSAITKEYHGGRTADKQAGWFLPYLESGMTLLDCGCGPGLITAGLARIVEPGQVTGVDKSEDTLKQAKKTAAASAIGHMTEETVIHHAISNGIATLEELEDVEKELQKWQNTPSAFMADAHCEPVGRKP